jgi:hypothetical protein
VKMPVRCGLERPGEVGRACTSVTAMEPALNPFSGIRVP